MSSWVGVSKKLPFKGSTIWVGVSKKLPFKGSTIWVGVSKKWARNDPITLLPAEQGLLNSNL